MKEKMYWVLSLLMTFFVITTSGCGRNVSDSEEGIRVALSTENIDSDEKYLNYLQECIAEVIVQSTGCSSAYSDIEMAEDGTIAKVEIHSGEYAFSETEKDSIVQYIEKLDGNQNVEIVFHDEAQELSSNDDSLKNSWYETRYYPIYMGGPDWGKHSMDEVFDANNPPHDLLFSMSSEELAALAYESPYLVQMLTYFGEDGHIDYSIMFGFLELHSDIFYELLRREDGIKAMLVYYQNSGVDVSWLDEGNYDSMDKKWLAEVLGSQFIRYYSAVFTEEETDLAKQIILEKNNVYLNSENTNLKYLNLEYFNVSDIEYHEGNNAGEVRVLYMTQDQISERENSFKIT
jgi:pyridoxine 5'-phosphate synthase PdxJ